MRRRCRTWILALLVAAGPALGLGGCYERVVEAEGPYRGTVYEPNLEDEEDDGIRQLDEY